MGHRPDLYYGNGGQHEGPSALLACLNPKDPQVAMPTYLLLVQSQVRLIESNLDFLRVCSTFCLHLVRVEQ